ncbi:MAG: site-specific integrase [Sphingomonas sp.]|nr:MAG: site-specific integrase [Sphingomonas sp.]
MKRLANGDTAYSVNVMVDGQRIHRAIGRASEGVTRQQAEDAIEAFRTKAREGRLDLPKGRKIHPTFGELAPAYIRRLDENGGRNMKAKRQHVEQLLVPFFGGFRADRITGSHIQDYVRRRLDTGLKQATINRELATLSHLFRRFARWGWIKTDDMPDLEKGPEPRKRIVVLSDESIAKLMNAAVDDQDPRTWLFVAFGLNTAMRHGEIVRVRFADVDLDSRRIFIPQAKAGEREQPITPALATMIRQQRQMHGDEATWLFPSRSRCGKHPHRLSMAKQFLRAVLRAELNPAEVTPHVMRHTAITRLVRAGVDLPTIQRISGHKTLAMVLRYVHIHGEHIDTAIAAIDNAFVGVITPDLHRESAKSDLEAA